MTLETFRMCFTRLRTLWSAGLCTEGALTGGVVSIVGGTRALSGCVAARSGRNVSAGTSSTTVSDREMLVGVESSGIGFPHCGQNIARSRTDTPQNVHRREISISGSDIL